VCLLSPSPPPFAGARSRVGKRQGTGADVMRRIAAPMVGGILTSFIGELIVYPSIYFVWRALKLKPGPLFPETDGEAASVRVAGGDA